MDDSGAVLSFKDVAKFYVRSHLGRKTVTRGLEGVSAEVMSGEVFGLVGLNGSGKTTFFKLALGLLRPSAGVVSILGAPMGAPCPSGDTLPLWGHLAQIVTGRVRRPHVYGQGVPMRTGKVSPISALQKIGFLSELPYFYPFLTPRQTLRFYGRLSGIPSSNGTLEKKIGRILELVALSAQADRKVEEFSKGMVQRVGIAQAILHDPDILFLDEPASGLDPLAIKQIRDILYSLHQIGKTIILSSHSISELEKICGRVAVLKEGRIARTISASEWKQSPGGLESLFLEMVQP